MPIPRFRVSHRVHHALLLRAMLLLAPVFAGCRRTTSNTEAATTGGPHHPEQRPRHRRGLGRGWDLLSTYPTLPQPPSKGGEMPPPL